MIEVWRDVVGYEGLYKVSNLGRVMQLEKTTVVGYGAKVKHKNKIKNTYKKENGYICTHITKDKRTRDVYVHRLVAQAFIPNEENKPLVNHKDFDRANNKIDNLEWVTHSENNMWSRENMSNAHKGKKLSEEHKIAISNAIKGKKRKAKINCNRKTNTGEHHISKVVQNGYVSYHVGFRKNGERYRKSFKTIEKAIEFRNKTLDMLKAEKGELDEPKNA